MQGGWLLQVTPKQQFSTSSLASVTADACHVPFLLPAAGTWARHAGEEALVVTLRPSCSLCCPRPPVNNACEVSHGP